MAHEIIRSIVMIFPDREIAIKIFMRNQLGFQ